MEGKEPENVVVVVIQEENIDLVFTSIVEQHKMPISQRLSSSL